MASKFSVPMMAPFNMTCTSCGEYYRECDKMFMASKEDIDGVDYESHPMFRFCIQCCRCQQEIIFRNDPKFPGWVTESGARGTIISEDGSQHEVPKNNIDGTTNSANGFESCKIESKYEKEYYDYCKKQQHLNPAISEVRKEVEPLDSTTAKKVFTMKPCGDFFQELLEISKICSASAQVLPPKKEKSTDAVSLKNSGCNI